MLRRRSTDQPWSLAGTPLESDLPARRVTNWHPIFISQVMPSFRDLRSDAHTRRPIDWTLPRDDDANGRFLFTPPVPPPADVAAHLASEMETIRPVPCRCAKLCITYFPRIRSPATSAD